MLSNPQHSPKGAAFFSLLKHCVPESAAVPGTFCMDVSLTASFFLPHTHFLSFSDHVFPPSGYIAFLSFLGFSKPLHRPQNITDSNFNKIQCVCVCVSLPALLKNAGCPRTSHGPYWCLFSSNVAHVLLMFLQAKRKA